MSNEYKPVLICNGDEKHLREDGYLICGGCGYMFDSRSTEYFFSNIEIKPDCRTGVVKVQSAPLYCEHCGQEFEKVHFSELGETLFVVPRSKFKKRYVTSYGELILPNEHSDAEFVPSWDPSKRRKMAYIDSIAYMLYSLGCKANNMSLRVGQNYWGLYFLGSWISSGLHEDICNISEESLRCHLGEFDKILASMHDMENDQFFSIGGNEDD